jgi:hypothetical protein
MKQWNSPMAPWVIALLLAGCTATGAADIPRIERDVAIACKAWDIAKEAAVVAGFFVPGVSSAAVLIGIAVDPVCEGKALAALSDPSTPQWLEENVEKLHRLMTRPQQIATIP